MKDIGYTKEDFIKVCNESKSMSEACSKLGLHFNTFKKWAVKYGCYNPNQSGKGTHKPNNSRIPVKEILAGKHPQYQTYKLKLKLIDEGYKEDKCELCGWDKKIPGNKYTPCELHHINGDNTDHRLENLILICPNCHSLQDHYRSRNQRAHK